MSIKKMLVLLLGIFSGNSLALDYRHDYHVASFEYGVPLHILYAIGLKESGLTTLGNVYRPWPYTLNIYGKSYRFNSYDKACESLQSALLITDAIDIGETQLHWKYQKADDVKPCDYFDRKIALKQTSKVLLNCYKKHSNWIYAAGCYHYPKSGRNAEKYINSYVIILDEVLKGNW